MLSGFGVYSILLSVDNIWFTYNKANPKKALLAPGFSIDFPCCLQKSAFVYVNLLTETSSIPGGDLKAFGNRRVPALLRFIGEKIERTIFSDLENSLGSLLLFLFFLKNGNIFNNFFNFL